MSGVKFYRDSDLPFFELKLCNTTELSYKRHAHEEYSLGIVDNGTSSFWYEGKVAEVYPKSMVFLPPELIHACNPVHQNNWQYKMLFINTKWVRGFMSSRGSFLFDNPIIRLFKEAFKVPPHTYQTLLRVNHAKKELRKQRAVAEVALEAGFYDQSHFIKVFKSHTGVTPEKYQKL